MTLTCTRRLTFEAGHRIMGHESKCANLHGHSYIAEIEARADLDDLGRVIDFSVLKQVVGGWIDESWDHGFLVWHKDTDAHGVLTRITGQKIFVMPANPTAENIAAFLLEKSNLLLAPFAVQVIRVVIHETANCKAEARL